MNKRSLQASNFRWGIGMLALALALHAHDELTQPHRIATLARTTVSAPVRHAADRFIRAAATASVPRTGNVAARVRPARLISTDPRSSLRAQQSKPHIV